MIVNSLLIRFDGGFVTVEDAGSIATYGRRQKLFALGNVKSSADATAIGQKELARLSAPLDGVQVEYALQPSQASGRPYADYVLGDLVTVVNRSGSAADYRVREIEVTEDEDGVVTVRPSLNSRLDEQAVRLERTVRRMIDGTLDGRSFTASLPSAASSVTLRRPEQSSHPVHWPAALSDHVDKKAGPIRMEFPGRLVWFQWTMELQGSGNSTLVFKKNGTTFHTTTLPGSTYTYDEFPDVTVDKGDRLSVTCTAANAAVEDLTLRIYVMRFT